MIDRAREDPVVSVVIGSALTLLSGQLAVAVTSPFLRPIRDLARGTERVAVGDYSRRLPVVQDDDLGALAASFNRMQAGLAERQRLQAAFGTYVDPALATRLIEQGNDVFTGERREVTVMFVDIRDFTPFAEANTAEDTVARLNALFEIVVRAVVDAGGHVNKFLGDGALAVFGAPNDLADHADAAVSAAVLIQRLVARDLAVSFDGHRDQHRCGDRWHHWQRSSSGVQPDRRQRPTWLPASSGSPRSPATPSFSLTKPLTPAFSDHRDSLTGVAHALKGKSAPTVVFGLDP